MNKNLLASLLLLFTLVVHSQSFQWVQTVPITFTANSQLISYSVTADPSGSVYMAGYKADSYPYGIIFGTQYYNKYDSNGNLLFSNEITGHVTIYNMTTDSAGNVIMMVGYVGSITIGTFELTSAAQGIKYIMLKINSLGAVLWHRAFTSTTSSIGNAQALTTDASDNIYVGYSNSANSFIEKISPSGTVLFTINQSQVDDVSSLSIDNQGNIYAAGSCANPSATFANVAAPLPTGITYNVYLVKYSATETFQWVKYLDNITCPTAYVKARTEDAVYLTSQLFDAYSFDNITTEGPTPGFEDVFIAKLNSDGNFQWVREVQGSGGLSSGNRNPLEVDAAGNVYFAGQTSGIINWGNNIITSSGAASGASKAVVLKFNPEGQVVMGKTAGGANYDRVDCIKLDNDRTILLAGLVKGNTSFDAFTFTAPPSQAYPFVAKLSNPTLALNAPETVTTVLYPNPSADYLYFSNITAPLDGIIYNILGQKIKSFVVTSGEPLGISTLAKGAYFIKTKELKTFKFTKL
ncbi:T9SS type A sorting domain-containing protein [Flavobacterium sp.]